MSIGIHAQAQQNSEITHLRRDHFLHTLYHAVHLWLQFVINHFLEHDDDMRSTTRALQSDPQAFDSAIPRRLLQMRKGPSALHFFERQERLLLFWML